MICIEEFQKLWLTHVTMIAIFLLQTLDHMVLLEIVSGSVQIRQR